MKIGFVGTGLMGVPMARRLLEMEISVIAYNRTATKLMPLANTGVEIAETPDLALKESDATILMLTDAPAIREVILSTACRAVLPGTTIVQMGTIAPSESCTLRDEVAAAGGEYFEAPVLGSIPEAKIGKLLVMAGATSEQFDRWQDLLGHFGENPKYIGEVGTAAALKLALNQLIGSLTAAFSLSLGLIRSQNIDPEVFMEIVRQSALYAPTFDKKLSRLLDRNFANPNFPAKHLLKDMKLVRDEADRVGLRGLHLNGICEILERALAEGLADLDYSALSLVVSPPAVLDSEVRSNI